MTFHRSSSFSLANARPLRLASSNGLGQTTGGNRYARAFADYWNSATGGTETTISNYNGTGQIWRVHTMTSNTTFTVTKNLQPFRYMVVGGGGGGGMHINDGQNRGPGGGYGGARSTNDSATLAITGHTVTIGGAGASNGGGGSSALGAITAAGGGAGGNCRDAPQTPNGGGGTSSNITGSSVNYGQNGTAGGNQYYGGTANVPGGGGGGGACGFGGDAENGSGGTAGRVIVAYQIG